MARKIILENLMKLAQGIGANPSKFMGTKTNISFLGKGPTSNILFQSPVRIKSYLRNRGSEEVVLGQINDAMGFATAGKLNPIQLELLNDNLIKIATIMRPSALPPLPSAKIMTLPQRGTGITGALPKQGKVEEVFFNNPKDPRLYKSRLPEPGPGEVDQYMGALNIKTGMSRAIARNLLLKDTRLKLKPEELFMLKEGKGEPLDLLAKYYGRSLSAYDDFLNNVNLEAARPDEFAEMILKNVRLIPEFARGGLARVLEI